MENAEPAGTDVSIVSEKNESTNFDKRASRRSFGDSSPGDAGKKPKYPPLPKYTKSDSTICPSYTDLQLPYRVVCRQRYERCVHEQQQQLIKEIKLHEVLQPQALSGVRIHREFCNPILKQVSTKDRITLTLKQERRVEYILKTPIEQLY